MDNGLSPDRSPALDACRRDLSASENDRRRVRAELEETRRLASVMRRKVGLLEEQLRDRRADVVLGHPERPSAEQRVSDSSPAVAGGARLSYSRALPGVFEKLVRYGRGALLIVRHPRLLPAHVVAARLLRAGGLFDPHFYLRTYPDVLQMRVPPLVHYVAIGAEQGRRPSALFDARYYLETNPEVAAARINPLVHYLKCGAAAGRRPNPLFDPEYYSAEAPEWRTSGLDPLSHYLRTGANAGKDPCPLFDSSFFLERYPDIAAIGRNPLAHYLELGAAEGRDPHPLFDTSFYIAEHPELRSSGWDPLDHFLRLGCREGFAPHPLFDVRFYVARYPEVSMSGLDPVDHYARTGAKQGCDPHPLFDTSFYLSEYPDVGASGLNPVDHYVRYGAGLGRNPNPLFDSAYYSQRYPEVAAEAMNPLEHYSRIGWRRGYDPGPLFRSAVYYEENPSVRRGDEDPLARFLYSLPDGIDPRDTGLAYRSWLRSREQASKREIAPLRTTPTGRQPSVSLLMALPAGAKLAELEQALAAIEAQTHTQWELVLAFGPGGGGLQSTVERQAPDPRIRCVPADAAASAPAMLNAALGACSGDLVAVVAHDEILDEGALAWLVGEIAEDPNTAIVYSDEDRLDEDGRRNAPHFKADWNRDLFLAWNYIGHLALVDRVLAMRVGGFRESQAPGHEYDLLLRVLEQAGDRPVRHVARVLCHRRSSVPPSGGAAADTAEAAAARLAVEEHLSRTVSGAVVKPVSELSHRIIFPLPQVLPLVSIVIPTRNRLDLLKPCVKSLRRTAYQNYEVIVVDNESDDPEALSYLRILESPFRVVRHGGEFNFAAINNAAVSAARGSILLFLNNDTEVLAPSWLEDMVRLVVRPEVGAVGAKLRYADGSIQHAGVVVGHNGGAAHALAGLAKGSPGYFGRAAITQECSAVSAACLAVRRAVFEEVGGFDAVLFPVNFNDVDLCLRLRKRGLKIVYCAEAELLHHESASRRATVPGNEAVGLAERWGDALHRDPFYNPNLSREGRTHCLGRPPQPLLTAPAVKVAARAERAPELNPYASGDNWSRAIEVQGSPPDRPPAPRWAPGISAVILTLDHVELIAPLLRQLADARSEFARHAVHLQIIVGDTGSTDPAVWRTYAELSGDIELARGLPYHFSRCNNQLFFERVKFDKTLFLNNDIRFSQADASLACLARELDTSSEVGIVGTPLRYPGGRVQHAGIDFLRSGRLRGMCYHPSHGAPAETLSAVTAPLDVPAVTGACLMIRSALFRELGGFDEQYRTECQDVALCLAARRIGFGCRLVPAGRIDHHENGTRPKGSEDAADRQRLIRRWNTFVEAQPW